MRSIRFTDGVSFDTDGPLRLARRDDGWYVVGGGMLLPVASPDEGREIIAEMRARAGAETGPASWQCEDCGEAEDECTCDEERDPRGELEDLRYHQAVDDMLTDRFNDDGGF